MWVWSVLLLRAIKPQQRFLSLSAYMKVFSSAIVAAFSGWPRGLRFQIYSMLWQETIDSKWHAITNQHRWSLAAMTRGELKEGRKEGRKEGKKEGKKEEQERKVAQESRVRVDRCMISTNVWFNFFHFPFSHGVEVVLRKWAGVCQKSGCSFKYLATPEM
jgi:hypothetical protein